MKNQYLLAIKRLVALSMVLFGASYSLWAYDFSAVSPSNGYFYYNIIDEENHYVEVTYPGLNPDLPWPSSFGRPEGSHFIIPTLVENDGVLYTVVAIGEYAFSGLSFQTLTLPVSVTSLGDHSLTCGITNLYYGGTLEQWMGVSIGGLVFSTNFNLYFDNVLLTDLVIPANLTEIGRSFERVNLTSVTFHNNVVSIAEYAFNGCTGLTSLSIPSSVIEIGEGAFFGCINLQQIVVDAGNSTYDSRNSCNAIIETSSNTLLFGSLGTFIPMGVTSIGQYAFAGFGLTSITIPDSVLSIGDHAFYGCRFLNTLTMPNSVTHLGESVFRDCRFLGSVVLSNALTELPDNCFFQCTYLSSIEIPTSVVSIGDYAFYDCRELRSIPIPSSVTSIGFGAFKECKTLSSIIIPNSVTTIGYEAFRGCSAMYMISIPNSISSIEFSTFRNIDDLRIVICLNETPPSLANQAFPGTPNNAVLYVPSGSVTAYQNSMWTGYFSSILDYSTYNPTILSFADPVVKDICVNYYDRTYDGELDIYEIQAITSLSGFRGNTEMVSFDELQYFTGLTSISDYAFEGCTGLTSIEIPNSVTSIGNYTFQNCTGLTSVTIPNSVTSIGSSAFSGCSGLTSVTIPNSVTSIFSSAFSGCSGLTSVEIPNSVTSIGSSAFSGCSGLTSVSIPNSVTSIFSSVFSGCSGLTSVEIPNSVTSIGDSAFSGCSGLTSVTIPNSVTSIGRSAFSGCSGLTSVTIPNSVTSIGSSAFSGCSGLSSVEIPNSVTSIGSATFQNCSSLTSVTIGNSVTSIGDYAFEGCTGLTSIEIPNSVTSIGNYTFLNCTGLTSVTIPNSVTSIGNYTFRNCTGLTSVTIPNSVTSIGRAAFYVCTSLTSVTIPNSVTSIGDYAFAGCTGLTSIEIPNSVTSIGDYAFEGCTGLTSVTINSVTSTGNYTFRNCTGLTSVTIGNSVTSIGGSAFVGCTGLTSVTIPNSVTSIGSSAFSGCSGLTSVTIPNSVTLIDRDAFYVCTGLTSVTIGNSVTSIKIYTFYGCTGLTSVTIGNSVTSIGGSAFSGCSGLTRLVVLAETPPSLTESVFDFVNLNNIMLYVPCNTSSLYQSASGWNGFNNYVELCPTEVTVSSDPMDGGIVSGTGTYNYGDTCTLVATPNMGYKFLNWTENDVIISSENEYKILVEEDYLLSGLHSYVAHFEAVTNHWTPVENMSGSMTFTGVIRIDGAEQANNLLELGAFCGEECRGTALPYNIDGQFIYLLNVVGNTNGEAISFRLFEHDLQQELDVYCANEVVFQDGGFEGFDELYEFNFLNSYIISAAVDPEEGGTVNGIGSYYYSTQCTLSATANENYAFDNWTLEGEMVSTESAFSFIVTGPQHYVAHFHMVNCPILLSASPEEGGTVEGEGTYLYGTSCTVGAMANVGYTFEYWTLDGQVVSNEATYTFTVNGPGEFVAHFTLNSYNITVGAIPADAGTVAGGGIYYHGTTCTLTAIPSDGYEFNSWIKDGIIVSTDAEYSFEVTEGGDYWANFSPFTYEVNVTVNPAGAGTVTGSGSFTQGSSCTLVAQPNENFAFSRWVVNGTIVSTNSSYTFTITGDIEVEAYFDYAHSRVLTAGWTWWSTYVEQEGISGLTMLENSLGTSGIQIRDQNGYVQYMPSLNRWIGNITITNEKGYKIRVSEECTATMTGFLANPEDHPITIVQGWNWIGYPMLQPQSVSSALSDLTPTTGDIIKGQGPFSSYYEGIGWLPEFNLEPGKSYLYYSSNEVNKTFTYANVRGGSTVAEIDNRLCDNDIVGSFDNPYQVDFRSMSGNEQTHWQSLNNFSGSVTIQGVLVINGDEYIGENIEIGAFCGDQCRGSALPYGTLVMGHRLYFISIGGDTDGELITFRLWDHDSNQELEYESQTTITFHDNDNYGQMGDWYEIEFLQDQYQYVQEVSLASGWNWWAPTVAATLQDLETALGANGLAIMAEDGSTLNYVNGQWNGPLESLVLGQMYRINTSSPCEFTLTGSKPASVEVSLAHGAHWFGFTGSAPTAVGTVFGTAFGPVVGDKVISQNGGFAIYNGTAWQGTLTTLQPGQGYVYVSQSNETKTLVVE